MANNQKNEDLGIDISKLAIYVALHHHKLLLQQHFTLLTST